MLLSAFSEKYIEAGLDEAGRGCLAGPVVAAAVILPKDYTHPLLNDSKQLSATKREALREEIKRDAICWAVAEVSNHKIDEINILNASYLAMHLAVDQLETRPELLLVDGNRFKPYKQLRHQCIIKGDGKYYSIAAASILAKTYRDDLMHQLSADYDDRYRWCTNVGYPTKAHRKAIEEFGVTPYHRMSFQLLEKQLKIFEENGRDQKNSPA